MSTLSGVDITRRLNNEKNDGIVVDPILDEGSQINQIGIDCRLSNQFIVYKTQRIGSFDIKDEDPSGLNKSWYSEIILPFGTPFVLHPQTMVLGSTFEFIHLPDRIEASIEGRSSWARLGLIIATAVYIEPGYSGCVTLELSNISHVPLKLYPGVRIGQLIFRETTKSTDYSSKKYQCPIGPEVSRLEIDDDCEYFLRKQKT